MSNTVQGSFAAAFGALAAVQAELVKLQNECAEGQGRNREAVVCAITKILETVPAINSVSRATRDAMEMAVDIERVPVRPNAADLEQTLKLLETRLAVLAKAKAEAATAFETIDAVQTAIAGSGDKAKETLTAFLPKPAPGDKSGNQPKGDGSKKG